ncbi:steroid 17-alpha-hydroxylase/17,20 lyase-like isoform X1 [Anneissia japonica]|uniref:steroid 17-alpha-hydroxylase/17,20 lyase-like isoform X1 n=1 Tax=Anneissia japonica TaxID=1529436 RepID=UPI001425B4FC|nr:steroid 17-alpha-hydroxylase/17,20 lyase-like isoform X1 [Anneissia japonica]XP_033120117.1 steroid 17-alpha-hydroxylase/17,20 lyase-like isoform X1 [Anneissia japonica]XP_033120118.1 steroid 17-alpha-hydroxylase/17,20 lyase-like isoform X1 [Anneissia japonica]
MSVFAGETPPQEVMKKMSKIYGDIFSLKIGSFWAVVLNNYELVQEALLTKPNDFSGRPPSFLFDWFTDGQKDIAVANPTPIWKYHRMLAHSAIRKFASGEYLEKLHEEIRPLLTEVMSKKMKTTFDPNEIITFAIYNVIASMCFGYKYKIDDPRLEDIAEISRELNEGFGNGWIADFIPWFRYIPNPHFYSFKKVASKFFAYIMIEVRSHLDNFDPDRPANDLIDLLLKSQKEEELKGNVDQGSKLTDIHIKQIIADLFSAGIDTQNVTLLWAIACVVDNPDVQEKVKKEIDDLIGDRPPRLSDRGKLPYTEATIMEIMRYKTGAPLTLTHRAMKDSKIGTYNVPEDTWVFINLWALHNDPKYWNSPEKFKPDRFLDPSNSVKQRLPSYLPFSTGRRVCVGESLAKANLFLTFVWLIQNYKFTKPSSVRGPVTTEGKPQLISFPMPYKIRAERWE